VAEMREVTSGLRFPEGPVVLPDGSVSVVELEAGRITRIDPSDGSKETISEIGGGPNGAQLGPDGQLWVCNNGKAYGFHDLGGQLLPYQPPPDHEGGRIERVDLATGEVERIYDSVDGRPIIAPNDLVFDEHGGFWFTDHGIRHERSADRTWIMYGKADGSEVREVAGPVDSPNGIGLSPAGDKLYVGETYSAAIWAWDVSGPGEVAPVEGIIENGATPLGRLAGFVGIDSLAVDAEGNICLATLVAGTITNMSPAGEIVDTIAVGDLLPTNIAFGGDDMRTAYITASASGKLMTTEWPRAGLKLAYQS
jgi:gluconolactonase